MFVFALILTFFFVDFFRVVVGYLDDSLDVFFCWTVLGVGPCNTCEGLHQLLVCGGEAVEAAYALGAFSCFAVDVIPGAC